MGGSIWLIYYTDQSTPRYKSDNSTRQAVDWNPLRRQGEDENSDMENVMLYTTKKEPSLPMLHLHEKDNPNPTLLKNKLNKAKQNNAGLNQS